MTNIDTQIIFDKNGNPIPQYLDVTDKTGGSAGTMKPIAGQNGAQFTQLTGSNVEEVYYTQNKLATAGSRISPFNNIKTMKYKSIYVLIRSSTPHDYLVSAAFTVDKWDAAENPQFFGGVVLYDVINNTRPQGTPVLHTPYTHNVRIDVTNKSDVDQHYDVYLMGVL